MVPTKQILIPTFQQEHNSITLIGDLLFILLNDFSETEYSWRVKRNMWHLARRSL